MRRTSESQWTSNLNYGKNQLSIELISYFKGVWGSVGFFVSTNSSIDRQEEVCNDHNNDNDNKVKRKRLRKGMGSERPVICKMGHLQLTQRHHRPALLFQRWRHLKHVETKHTILNPTIIAKYKQTVCLAPVIKHKTLPFHRVQDHRTSLYTQQLEIVTDYRKLSSNLWQT